MTCLRLVCVLVVVVLAAGCTSESPVSPSSSAAGIASLDAGAPKGSPGVYELTFNIVQSGGLQPVSSLPVLSREMILKAHVTDAAGVLATRGTAIFEYCSLKGGPPNDITRADEAPKEACENGSASWARLGSWPVDAGTCPGLQTETGNACFAFGTVRIPRTVGFRFRYTSQKSNVVSGTSQALNFTWE